MWCAMHIAPHGPGSDGWLGLRRRSFETHGGAEGLNAGGGEADEGHCEKWLWGCCCLVESERSRVARVDEGCAGGGREVVVVIQPGVAVIDAAPRREDPAAW